MDFKGDTCFVSVYLSFILFYLSLKILLIIESYHYIVLFIIENLIDYRILPLSNNTQGNICLKCTTQFLPVIPQARDSL